jgi:cyclase
MLRPRVIPCLLLRNSALVKTVKFEKPGYVGDPINAVKIFNEKEVDELIFLDIVATKDGREPPFDVIEEIASQCFMPVTFGGGVRSLDSMAKIFWLGIEKVSVNSFLAEQPAFLRAAADRFGSQSVVASIDVRQERGGPRVFTHGGTRDTGQEPERYAAWAQEAGAGEVLLTAIDRDGTQGGYDLDLVRRVTAAVDVPVVACGGAGTVEDLALAVRAGASAAAAGSMVVYHGPHRAVLINFPSKQDLRTVGA